MGLAVEMTAGDAAVATAVNDPVHVPLRNFQFLEKFLFTFRATRATVSATRRFLQLLQTPRNITVKNLISKFIATLEITMGQQSDISNAQPFTRY